MPLVLPEAIAHTQASAAVFNATKDRAEYAGDAIEALLSPLEDYTDENPWYATVSNPSIGSGDINFQWRQIAGSMIRIEFGIIMASNTALGTGSYRFRFPSGITQRTSTNLAMVSGSRGQATVIHTNVDLSRTKHQCITQVYAENYFEVGYAQNVSPYQILTLGANNGPFPSGSWNENSWISGWVEVLV